MVLCDASVEHIVYWDRCQELPFTMYSQCVCMLTKIKVYQREREGERVEILCITEN